MAQAKQDMGSGSVKKLMLQLMIPAVVAQVVNLLYNIVDRIYIGHIAGIGAAALTGVGHSARMASTSSLSCGSAFGAAVVLVFLMTVSPFNNLCCF